MKRIYKIMRDKKGEGYIDAAVVVFCVMFVIALGVRIFPVFITKIQPVSYTHLVKAGEEIKKGMLQEVEVGGYNLPENVLRSIMNLYDAKTPFSLHFPC